MQKQHEPAILKFDNEILIVIAMCEDFQKEVNDLKGQMNEAGNDFSARLLSNEQVSFFVKRYSDIVIAYETACKKFSQSEADLEKIMHIAEGTQEMINDIKKTMNEAETSMNFKTDFEHADLLIFESFSNAVMLIIEGGKVIHNALQEILSPCAGKNSRLDDIFLKIFKGGFWLFLGIGPGLLIYGFLARHKGSLLLGSIMSFSALLLFVQIKLEKRNERKK